MDYREFEYMIKVAECRSVTRAAAELHVSQPALSRTIRNVEESLDVKLFDRSTIPLSLTYAGERYIESARRILMENSRFMKELRDITQHMTGKLKIGTSHDRAAYMMPRLLPHFFKKYPGIDVEVLTDSGQKLTEDLRAGRIDLLLLPATAVTQGKQGESAGICAKTIYTEEMVLAVHSGNVPPSQRIGKNSVCLEALGDMEYFLLFQAHAARAFCDDLFKRNRIRPHVKMEFTSNISCYRMAAAGMGVAIVPFLTTQLTDAGDDVELFSIGEEGETWDVKMFYRIGEELGQPELELLRLAREIFSCERLKRFYGENAADQSS